MKILITGGAGFIGSSLGLKLLERGEDIYFLDIKDKPNYIPSERYLKIDVRDKEKIRELLKSKNFDGVIHLAAVSRVIWGEENPEECVDINVNGTENLLSALAEVSPKTWVIFGSSREVYGEPEKLPVKESDEKKPINIYGHSKLEGENLTKKYSSEFGLNTIVLRFSNVYGNERDILDRVIPKFILSALNNKPLTIQGGKQVFDFTYIDYTVKGLLNTIDYISSFRQQGFWDDFHILTGMPTSIMDLAEMIIKYTNSDSEIVFEEERNFDVNRFYGDTEKIRSILNLDTPIYLEEGLQKTIKLYKEPMRVLQVIHGFPPYYMAGSEVYAYNLSKELSNELDVYIFTRVENSFLRNFELFPEEFDNLKTYRVNNITPEYSLERKYLNRNIDTIFRKVLEEIKPNIIHIQHLSHLSTNIVNIVKEYNLPIVFTIHDFWMFCVRGQLLTRDLQICNGPDFSKCVNCLSYLNTQEDNFYAFSLHMKNILSKIDIFLSPSKTLRNFYIENGIPEEKVLFSPYGFDKSRITFKKKKFEKNSKINFGFVGRIIPAKGVHLLIEAFNKMNNKNAHLYIFGSLGKDGIYLKKLAKSKNIHFEGGFDNREIDKILDKIDVLVVPSIWYENSPLVIQESFLKGIPVITSNIGGMAELVKDGVNGFLFNIGNVDALAEIMKKIADNPEILNNLEVTPDDVRDIKDDANFIKQLYKRLVK